MKKTIGSTYPLEELLKLSLELKPSQYHQLQTLRKKGFTEHAIIALYKKVLDSKK